jgi:hypothetical protein
MIEAPGLVLGLGAFAVFASRTWAWVAVTCAHAVALAGFVGVAAVAAPAGGPHPDRAWLAAKSV